MMAVLGISRAGVIGPVVFATLGLGLGACNTTGAADSEVVGTSAAPKSLPPLTPQMAVFMRNAAVASFIADVCPDERLKDKTRRGLATAQINAWKARGYTTQQIATANDFNRENGSPQQVISYLKARGARQGDLDSICNIAKVERANNTAIGAMLAG